MRREHRKKSLLKSIKKTLKREIFYDDEGTIIKERIFKLKLLGKNSQLVNFTEDYLYFIEYVGGFTHLLTFDHHGELIDKKSRKGIFKTYFDKLYATECYNEETEEMITRTYSVNLAYRSYSGEILDISDLLNYDQLENPIVIHYDKIPFLVTSTGSQITLRNLWTGEEKSYEGVDEIVTDPEDFIFIAGELHWWCYQDYFSINQYCVNLLTREQNGLIRTHRETIMSAKGCYASYCEARYLHLYY